MRSLISIFCALVYLLGCSGCALFSLEKTVHYEDPEGQFSLESITGIERGSTSEAWLFKTFGTPIEQQALAKEVNIHTWKVARQKRTKGSIFLLIRYRKLKEDVRYLHAVTQHGIVLKVWQDAYQHVDPDGAMRLAKPFKKSMSADDVVMMNLPVTSAEPE